MGVINQQTSLEGPSELYGTRDTNGNTPWNFRDGFGTGGTLIKEKCGTLLPTLCPCFQCDSAGLNRNETNKHGQATSKTEEIWLDIWSSTNHAKKGTGN